LLASLQAFRHVAEMDPSENCREGNRVEGSGEVENQLDQSIPRVLGDDEFIECFTTLRCKVFELWAQGIRGKGRQSTRPSIC
jgi:hypothetical protein